MGALRLLNAIKAWNKKSGKGLMFVEVSINGRSTRAMVDTGATHNFVADQEARRLGLKLEHD